MYLRCARIAILIPVAIFANTWEYPVSSYTYCTYNTKEMKYEDNCTTQTDVTKLTISIDESSITVNGSKYYTDSTKDDSNSDNEPITYVFTKEASTKNPRAIVLSKRYINIVALNTWKISYVLVNNDTSYYTGSGFGVNAKTIVTNYHVIKEMKTIAIKIGDNYSSAKVQYGDKDLDLAILKVDSTINSCKIEDSAQEIGNEVVVYGYPKIQLQGQSIKATRGIISSKFGFQDDIKTYQIDAAVQNGNSGGPLANKNKVVGVVVSKLTEGQNVNYAIKSAFLLAMLKSTGTKNIGAKNPIDCTYLIVGWDK